MGQRTGHDRMVLVAGDIAPKRALTASKTLANGGIMSARKQETGEDERLGQEYILTLSCPDKPGIVYAVSSFLVQHSANIIDSQQYGEAADGVFFMRVHFSVPLPGKP